MIPVNLHTIAQHAGVPIVQLNSENVAKIIDSPQAQLRTARYKKAVYIVGEHVFKGAFNSNDVALINNLRFNHALELLEAALQLHDQARGSLPWKFLGCAGNDQYYLAASNIGRRQTIPFEVVNSKLEMNVKVVRRGAAVKRVSDIEDTEHLTQEIKLAALQHLYLRFLLDIGDSGTHNVLIREDYDHTGRLIAGIDLEETRGAKKKDGRLEHLFKKPPSRKQIGLYGSDVCKIKSFSDRQLDQHTSDRLRDVGINLEGLNDNMKLWESL